MLTGTFKASHYGTRYGTNSQHRTYERRRISMGFADIEKENLEAHVELCAERYKNLETKLDTLDRRMTTLEKYVVEIKEGLNAQSLGVNKQIIAIGTTIIGVLIAAIFGLVTHVLGK